MKILELKEAKAKFSSIMEDILSGEEFALSFDQKHEAFAVIVPYGTWKNTKKRNIGTLEKRGSVEFSTDWQISEEEFCNYYIPIMSKTNF